MGSLRYRCLVGAWGSRRRGYYRASRMRTGSISQQEYARNQPPPGNERYCWARDGVGCCYRIRCFRVRGRRRSGAHGGRTEEHHAFGEPEKRSGGALRSTTWGLGSSSFSLRNAPGNYDINGRGGGPMVPHLDNATRHSRRNDRCVFRIDISDGRVVERGSQQRVCGRGASKCRSWGKCHMGVSTKEVAKDRCERSPIALENEPGNGQELKDTQSEVDRYPPPGSDRSKKSDEYPRWIVGRVATARRRAVGALPSPYDRRAGSTPPYENRLSGAELRREVIKPTTGLSIHPTGLPKAFLDLSEKGVGGRWWWWGGRTYGREAAG